MQQTDPITVKYGSISTSNEVKEAAITGVYWYRWYIIFLFGFIGFVQNILWLTWTPISASVLCAYGFTNDEIEMLESWNQVGFLLSAPFIVWLLNTGRLRLTMVLSTFLPALGCGLQCLPVSVHVFKCFALLNQIITSIGNCVVLVGPTLFSNVWFPTRQRVTATSIATVLPVLGSAPGFLLGPVIVEEPSHNAINGSSCNISHTEEMKIKHGIMQLIYIEFSLAAIAFICTLIYFPNHPPLPPSVTASLDRLDLKNTILPLIKNREFMMYNLAISIPAGISIAYMSILNLILSPFGLSQTTTGMIVLVASFGGGVMGLFMGWCADRWKGHLRVMLILLFGISFIASLYFMFITSNWFHMKWLKFSEVGVWVSFIIIGILLSASFALGSELISESAFPANEAVSLGINVWCSTVFSFILLLVSGVTSDLSYATYMLVGSLVVATVALLLGKEPDNRLRIDMEPNKETDQMTDHSHLLTNQHDSY